MISNKLDSLINNEKKSAFTDYNLNSIKSLLEHFDNPHNKIKTIHIAGTNGKGSVAHSIANIFKTSGYKVGLYTSPNLIRINERIRVNDNEIPDNIFNDYIDKAFVLIDKNKDLQPTYFDILTLVAFQYFYDQKVDVAVMETGLGGRLDSTNVITPLCSILTDISMDHNLILGNTIEKITGEKCGIIKKGVPVVTSNDNNPILSIIKDYCHKNGSDLFQYNKDFQVQNISLIDSGFRFDYKFNISASNIHDIQISLPGEFQCKNMALSITALLLLVKDFPGLTIENIKKGIENLKIPGRFEKLHERPLVIFDPAHNPAAMEKTIEILKKRYHKSKRIIIILTLMKDKNYSEIIDLLYKNNFEIYYYILNDERGYNPSHEDNEKFKTIENTKEIFDKLNTKDYIDILFFFTGSFRLYNEAQCFVKNFTSIQI